MRGWDRLGKQAKSLERAKMVLGRGGRGGGWCRCRVRGWGLRSLKPGEREVANAERERASIADRDRHRSRGSPPRAQMRESGSSVCLIPQV